MFYSMRRCSSLVVAVALAACGSDAPASPPAATGAAGASGASGASQAGAGGTAGSSTAGAAGASPLGGSGGAPKNPSSCKLVHQQDQPCKEEGLVCVFDGDCRVTHVCQSGAWQVTFDGACCPAAPPAAGAPCPALGLSCVFDAMTVVCAADGWST